MINIKRYSKRNSIIKPLVFLIISFFLLPVSISGQIYFQTVEYERAQARASLLLYRGTDDLKNYIDEDPLIEIIPEVSDFQKVVMDGKADTALTLEGDRAYIYFSPGRIASHIALERIERRLSLYGELSSDSFPIVLRNEAYSHEIEAVFGYASTVIISLLLFSFSVWAGYLPFKTKNNNRGYSDKTTAFNKMCSSIVISLCVFVLLIISLFITSALIVPNLMPQSLENFTLLPQMSAVPVIFLLAIILAFSTSSLYFFCCLWVYRFKKIGAVLDNIPLILILLAIFVNMGELSGEMSSFVWYIPMINLNILMKNVIMMPPEWGIILIAAVTNIIFAILCLILTKRWRVWQIP